MTKGALLKKLYYQALRLRLVEEKIVELYPEQQIRCPVHLSIGQEGVAAGVGVALAKKDLVMSGHRAHGHYLTKGGNLKAMFAEMYGKATGCCGGRGGSMHLIDLSVNFIGSTPIVASTIPIATGLAWAEQMKKSGVVTVVYFGEAATEEGVWHESMNFAVLHHLPILFVCENNLYSVYTPLKDRQPNRKLADLAAAHGASVATGDGNDAVAVYDMTTAALKKIRAGKGPVFLEFSTYRWREHCGPNYDNSIGYRTEAEFKKWQKLDPLPRLEKQVLTATSPEWLSMTHQKVRREINRAVTFAKASPYPNTAGLFNPGAYAN